MLDGQSRVVILTTDRAAVRIVEDRMTNSFSIGLNDGSGLKGVVLKSISKELHDLMKKELENQTGFEFFKYESQK